MGQPQSTTNPDCFPFNFQSASQRRAPPTAARCPASRGCDLRIQHLSESWFQPEVGVRYGNVGPFSDAFEDG